MTLPITIQLTEAEAHALNDALEHLSRDMEARLPDVKLMTDDERELADIFRSMYNISQTVSEMIEGAITQNVTMGKPGACPQCGEDNSKAPFLLEQTGADAHCNHEVEYNYSCDNCRCRFDEVWMYSHKEVTRR